MIERVYYRVKLNTDQIIYSQSMDALTEAKLNENIVKDPSKTYLVWKGDKFPNSSNATFKAPEGCTIDWGDGTIETFTTASTEVTTHTYTDGIEYHLISLSNYTVVDSTSFAYCSSLTSLTIGNSVTSISDNAFRDCSGLTTIIIPDSVTFIGDNAFFGCSGLTSVTIPDSVTGIGYQAFYNCSSLTSVTIPDSVTTISFATFSGCIGLTSVTIGNSVRNIGSSAFENCSGLTSVTIPDSVTFMGDYAFSGCSGLKTVKISAINPPTLGSNAFETSLEKIIVPKSSIEAYKSADGWSTYADKIVYEVDSSDLVSLEAKLNENIIKDPSKTYLVWKGNQFPNSTNATFKAPEGCTIDWGDGNVETFETASTVVNTHTYTDGFEYHLIVINGLTSISNSAFRGCSSLTSVTIGNSVTSIGNNAFFGCSGLTSVTIGNSVTSIGNNAFRDCSGLTTIIIPDSVTFIDIGAFSGYSGLKTVKISAINPPTIDYSTFSETSLEKIIVPKSSIDTYKSAAIWSTYADKIVYEVDSSDLNAVVTNLENGTGTGSIQQKGITYNELITDYEPNMAAWVIAKNGNAVPADIPAYLNVLQNSIVPTSEQVVDILNNHKNDVNTVITNFKTLPSPYESYGIDSLIAGALAGYGLTSSSDLSNIVGKVGSAAAIFGAMNKAFSPGAFAGGVGCEAGDEGNPGNSVCAFAYGSNVKTKGTCSVVFGRGNKEYKIDGETEGDKQHQRIYLDNLAEAGGTVTGTGDDRVGETGINKGNNNFMAGNCHYIGEGAGNNAVVGNQNIIGAKNANSDNANNFISGLINYIGLSKFCGIIGNRNQIRNSENIFLAGHSLLANRRYHKTVVGLYNEDKANTHFEVGNGTGAKRSNAFEVLQDGRAKVQTAPTENNDVVRKLELDTKFDKTGGTITGDMVVGGNFTVQGKTTTVDSETLRVSDKLIEVGKGNTAPLTSPAGLITPKYDGTNNGGIVYDHTGTAYVGDISFDSNGNVDVNNSDLQPIATRNATITNGNLIKWDSTNHKLVDAGQSVDNLFGLTARYVSTSILGG